MRRWLAIGAGALAALVVSFLAGRASRPAEVREVVKVELRTEYVDRWRERVVEVRAKDTARRVVTRTEREPTGRVVIVRTEEATSHTDTAAERSASGEAAQLVELHQEAHREELARPSWRFQAAAGWRVGLRPSSTPDLFQAGGAARLGPLWLGGSAWRVEGRFYVGPSVSLDW